MSDRHMEKAREAMRKAGLGIDGNWDDWTNQIAGIIATALAEAEREGMRRAAEIAKPLEEWHEDFGYAVWWTFKDGDWLGEPSYIGSPFATTGRVITPIGRHTQGFPPFSPKPV